MAERESYEMIEISAEDVTYIDPGLTAPIVGRDAYIQYLTPLKGKYSTTPRKYVDPKVAVYGDTAVLTIIIIQAERCFRPPAAFRPSGTRPRSIA